MWLKTDTLMPMHPKITDLAEQLGTSRRETVGLMMDFFVWVRSYAESGKVSDFYGKKTVENGKGVELLSILEKTGWIVDGWIKNWHIFGGAEIVEKAKRDPIKYREMIEFYNLIPYGKIPEKNGKITGKNPSRLDKKREEENKEPIGFVEFWQAYPRKENKGQARKMWLKHKPELQAVLKAIGVQKLSDQWKKDGGKFIPHPATWINAEAWTNEIVIKKPYSGPSF